MHREPDSDGNRANLDEVLADYMRRVDQGETIDVKVLIGSHPELADELRDYFSQVVALDRIVFDNLDLMRQGDNEVRAQHPVRADQERAEQLSGEIGTANDIVPGVPSDRQSSTTSSAFDQSATSQQIHSITAPHQHATFTVPMRIGPYEILDFIGEGGYGKVYLARDVDLQRPVAIKLAKRGDSHSTEQVCTFLTEARRVAQLRHPGIVNIFDVSRGDTEAWYLVMEYIDGPSLAEVFREGQLSVVALVNLLVLIADAVHCAHTNGILHRDLKPANILLNKNDQLPRIVDFGMALDEREQFYAPRHAAGTPYCMALEQVRGETHRLDARTDIWSLGVMLYEGLTGKRPFVGENVSDLFNVILQDDPVPLSHSNLCVPIELQRICLKCLSKRMNDRYETAAELAADFRRWIEDSSKKESAAEARPSASEARGPTQIVPKGLRPFGADDAGYFLDLLPGPRGREGLPESVNQWIRAIENRDQQPERAVLVLYGPSGSGKSSFVRAGLVPLISGITATICVDSAAGDLEQRILESLHCVSPNLPARVGLVQACSLIRTGAAGKSGGKVLIVLDQFEQWLHAHKSRISGELSAALRQCDGQRLQCLIVVRSDFWLGITRFLRELEVPLIEGSNCAHLDQFDIRHAHRVLTAFGRSYGSLPPAGEPLESEHLKFLEQAAEQIAGDGWVVPVRLALFAEMLKGRDWTPDTLQRAGGERGLRVAYLDQVFASPLAAPSHRRFRRHAEAVLRALLPEEGVELKGRCQTRWQLKQVTGLVDHEQQFNELMEILDSQLRLITPTEGTEVREPGAASLDSSRRYLTAPPAYQLTHDYLVPAVREWLGREQQSTRAGRARLCLEERDRQWLHSHDPRFLPSLPELVRIVTLTDRSLWTASQASMIRKSARRHARQLVTWVFTAAALSIGCFALFVSTRPPDPLLTFQDPNLPAAQRMAAFDRLDLSNVTALGPVIHAIKREQHPDVLRHAIDGMHEFVQEMQTGAGSGGNSFRDLILMDITELLSRDQIVGGDAEDHIRATLFSTYASLVPAPEVLEFVADAVERNHSLGKDALLNYLRSLDTQSLLELQSTSAQPNNVPEASINTVTNLVRLMDAMPPGNEAATAANLLARLPAERLVSLFMASFVDQSYQYAERSTDIYVKALPTRDLRQSEARRLLAVMGKSLSRLISNAEQETSFEQLDYILLSIRHLQSHADFWDRQTFDNVRSLFQRRQEFRDSAVIDAACAAYAAMYLTTAAGTDQVDLSDLEPLRQILNGQAETIEHRCAAANSLATIDHPSIVADLAAIAESASEPMRLRSDVVEGLESIGRNRRSGTETQDITDVLVRLFDTEKCQSDELLPDVVRGMAALGGMGEFKHVLSVLPRRDHDLNLNVQDAIFSLLFRNPQRAGEITEQSLVAVVALTDEERRALFPSADQFLADIVRMRDSCDRQVFETAYRHLAEGLANLSARHNDPSVRRLAQQNVDQLQYVDGLPVIDSSASAEIRERQLARWLEQWAAIAKRLRFDADREAEKP